MIWIVAIVVGLVAALISYGLGVFHGIEAVERKNRGFALWFEAMFGKRPEGWTYFTDLKTERRA